MTNQQKARLTSDWERVTKTNISEEQVKQIKAGIYFFGSEIECLRLRNHYHYSDPKDVRVKYSENLQTWTFCLEVKF